MAREGSAAETAELIFEEVPLVVHCPSCNVDSTVEIQSFVCPICGTPTGEIISGRELEVTALELES
jgi:hydrogenase nickel incorporation protein HypA/HybF